MSLVVLGVGAERLEVESIHLNEVESRAASESEAQITAGRAVLAKLFAAVESAWNDKDAWRRAKDVTAPYVADKMITQDQADTLVAAVTSPAARASLPYDPAVFLRQVKVPVLAISGSLDLAVPPCENFPLLHQALADDRDLALVELPGLNHLFQHAMTGTSEEAKKLSEPALANGEMLKIIADWVDKRAH